MAGFKIDSMRTYVRSMLASALIASAPTGMEAHYRAEGIAPGTYYLFAETKIMDTPHQWLREVTLAPGVNRFDLDNSVTTERPYCIRK
jgi:hypothetical protein